MCSLTDLRLASRCYLANSRQSSDQLPWIINDLVAAHNWFHPVIHHVYCYAAGPAPISQNPAPTCAAKGICDDLQERRIYFFDAGLFLRYIHSLCK